MIEKVIELCEDDRRYIINRHRLQIMSDLFPGELRRSILGLVQ